LRGLAYYKGLDMFTYTCHECGGEFPVGNEKEAFKLAEQMGFTPDDVGPRICGNCFQEMIAQGKALISIHLLSDEPYVDPINN
jgi:hypothetical protein